MKKIRDFEKVFGTSVSELNRESLTKIMQDERFKEFAKSYEALSSLMEEFLEVHKDDDFRKDLLCFKLVADMMNNEVLIGNLFDDFRNKVIDQKGLEEKLNTFLNSSDPLFVIATALCALIGTDMDVSEKEDLINNAIEKIETEIFPNLPGIKDSYIVVSNILDLIYQLREYYFIKFQIDLIKDDEVIDNELRKCNEYGNELLKDIPDIGIAPEELGYIDITKLDKGDDIDGTI